MTEYEREETQLLEYYINTQLIPQGTENEFAIAKHELELILTTKCDQRCKYCYITNHGNELYPEHASKETILKNADLFLDYIYNTKRCHFYTINLFGGELFRNNVAFEVFDLIKKYFTEAIKQEPDMFKYRLTRIIIPNNLSFVPERPDIVDKFFKYQEMFHKEFNTRIMFSWSCDGPYSADVREQKPLDADYYDKIIQFCDESSSGYHPMISYEGIDNLEQNYDWWLDVMNRRERISSEFQPMFLEVRNDGWTEESIHKYLNFLDHAMEKRFEMCHKDKAELAYHLLNGDGKNNSLPASFNYDFLKLSCSNHKWAQQEAFSCNLQRGVYLNCNNLSLALCHRLTYKHLVGAYFNSNGEHITGVTPFNLNAYINIHSMKASMHPGCDTCEYLPFCMQGCFGAQCESNGDPLMTCTSVCNMIQAKIQYLIKLYYEYGVFDNVENNPFGEIQIPRDLSNLVNKKLKEFGYVK